MVRQVRIRISFHICAKKSSQYATYYVGSGKTYTMAGSDNDPGIIPRTIQLIFNQFKSRASGWSYSIAMSMIEIYNEAVYDLLDESNVQKKIIGGKVEHLIKLPASNETELLDLWKIGINKRKVSTTISNVCSSRSHAISQLYVEGVNQMNQMERHATISLVDLAGSECPKTTMNMNETRAINSSISALNGVFTGLKKNLPIDFNQSSLTKMLKIYFEGESKTLLICNLSTEDMDIASSTNTSRFAQFK